MSGITFDKAKFSIGLRDNVVNMLGKIQSSVKSNTKLSWELEHLAHRENEFKEIYLVLSNQCKKYSCDLLDLCRSTEEVIAVLNRRNESEYDDDEQNLEDDKLTLSRLKMALKYEQKQVRTSLHVSAF
ncbi:Transient-receptor-potential-like protein [Araneus ventricosus]|uniref:Transient-receptor-potential-like protein n=1 Tax=Araneus ventricosus TaxID=182803 RepID=A0A4Y2IKA7_ARAVE|nr:Transient-receptor-potential-like protein [Araneus ventricosus]